MGRNNTSDPFDISGDFQTPETATGSVASNPFLASGAETPYIGFGTEPAEVYGMTNLDPDNLGNRFGDAPVNAIAALCRLPLQDYYPDYIGLILVNLLSNEALDDPRFGVGETTPHLQGLIQQGYDLNPMFGGSGPVDLQSLRSRGVYLTLVSAEQTGLYSLSASLDGKFYQASMADMQYEVLYLVVPEPTSLAILVVALPCLIRLRRS